MPANDFSDLDFSDPVFQTSIVPYRLQRHCICLVGSGRWRIVGALVAAYRLSKLMPRADWLISFIVHAVLLIVLAFIGVGRELLPTAVTLIAEEAAESPRWPPVFGRGQ